jgi:hypothetical protein
MQQPDPRAQAAAAIAALQQPGPTQRAAEGWLLAYRQSSEAWGFCLEALQPASRLPADVQLFAAQMLRFKLAHHALDAAHMTQLREHLLHLLSPSAPPMAAPLVAQLCLCLCVIILLLPAWQDAVAVVCAQLPPPTAIQLLEQLAEEAAGDMRQVSPPSVNPGERQRQRSSPVWAASAGACAAEPAADQCTWSGHRRARARQIRSQHGARGRRFACLCGPCTQVCVLGLQARHIWSGRQPHGRGCGSGPPWCARCWCSTSPSSRRSSPQSSSCRPASAAGAAGAVVAAPAAWSASLSAACPPGSSWVPCMSWAATRTPCSQPC